MRKIAARAEEGFARCIEIVCVALFVAITLDISFEILGRYVLGSRAPAWTLELALMLMIWLSMLGAGLGVRQGTHIAVMFGVQTLPRPLRVVAYRLAWLAVASFSCFLIWQGWLSAQQAMSESFSTMNVAVGWMNLAVPVGGVLMVVYAVFNLIQADVPVAYDNAVSVGFLARTAAVTLILLALGCGVATLGVQTMMGPAGVLAGSFVVLLALSVPVAFALGLASLVTALWMGVQARSLPSA